MRMSAFKNVVRVLSTLVAAGTISVSASGCRPKSTQMNSCSCACRQDGPVNVYISNKDFLSDAPCSSYGGAACNVTVVTNDGAYQVQGTWEGCVDHGKVDVQTKAGDKIVTVVVPPEILPPPPPVPGRGNTKP
jgi:hypothetical protein